MAISAATTIGTGTSQSINAANSLRTVPSKIASYWTRSDLSYVFFHEENNGKIGLAIRRFVLEIMAVYQIKRVKFEI